MPDTPDTPADPLDALNSAASRPGDSAATRHASHLSQPERYSADPFQISTANLSLNPAANPMHFIAASRALADRDRNREPSDPYGLLLSQNEGERWAVPHQFTFAAVWNWYQKYYYSYFDEAWLDDHKNTMAMRHDGAIHEMLRHRQLPTVSLPHYIECDDPDDPGQVKLKKELGRVVDALPFFQRLKLQLLEAIFYGKSGSQYLWAKKRIGGKTYTTIGEHKPVNGDKITYNWDGTPAIFIHASQAVNDSIADDPQIRKFLVSYRDRGPALVLGNEYLRDRFCIHEFEPSDTDYLMEPEKAAAVHGLGMRDRFYWLWNMRAELLSWYLDALQRVGKNGMLYAFYPTGNVEAKNATMQALKDLIDYNVAAFPRSAMDNLDNIINRIEPSPVGYDVMMQLLLYLDEIMRRGFLGQNLSSKSAPTGLGSGVADFQAGRFEDIIIYDATCLAETLDRDLIQKILKYNKWEYEGKKYRGDELPFGLRIKFLINQKDVAQLIAAAAELVKLGVPLDMEDLRDQAGFSAPKAKSTTLVMPGGEQGTTANDGAIRTELNHPGATQKEGTGSNPSSLGSRPQSPGGSKKPEQPEKFASDLSREIDRAASEAETPTDAQKEAGNYRKGHVRLHGLGITIETSKGRERSGKGRDGKPWSVTMAHHYGYIKRTESDADGDHVDVFLGDDPESELVFIINQMDPESGQFDEHKCMLGFTNREAAVNGYRACYSPGWKGLGSVSAMTISGFRHWLEEGDTARPVEPERYAATADNCGTGAGGFKAGNTCAAGGGGQGGGPSGGSEGNKGKPSSTDTAKSTEPTPSASSTAKKKFGKPKGIKLSSATGVATPEQIERATLRMTGKKLTPEDVAGLAGAPDDAHVSIWVDDERNSILVETLSGHPPIEAMRTIQGTADGEVYIHNDHFYVTDSDYQGHGIGLEVFGREVENALEIKATHIKTFAARMEESGYGPAMNGYYTWPRYGYDGDLEPFIRQKLPPQFAKARRVSDLMRTPEGREWWKKNGDSMELTFDLTPGSLSLHVWEAYQAERAKREKDGAGTNSTPSPKVTTKSLTESGPRYRPLPKDDPETEPFAKTDPAKVPATNLSHAPVSQPAGRRLAVVKGKSGRFRLVARVGGRTP